MNSKVSYLFVWHIFFIYFNFQDKMYYNFQTNGNIVGPSHFMKETHLT